MIVKSFIFSASGQINILYATQAGNCVKTSLIFIELMCFLCEQPKCHRSKALFWFLKSSGFPLSAQDIRCSYRKHLRWQNRVFFGVLLLKVLKLLQEKDRNTEKVRQRERNAVYLLHSSIRGLPLGSQSAGHCLGFSTTFSQHPPSPPPEPPTLNHHHFTNTKRCSTALSFSP